METSALISKLAGECSPVEVVAGSRISTVKFFFLGCLFSLLVLWFLGARELSTVRLPFYWVGEIGVLLALFAASIYCAFELRIPGEEVMRPWTPVLTILGGWLFYLVAGSLYVVNESGLASVWPIQGVSCGLTVIGLCAFPVAALLFLVKRGFPTATGWASFAIMVSGCVASVLGIEFHCVHESTTHHILYHFGPVVIMGTVGYVARRLMFGQTRGATLADLK